MRGGLRSKIIAPDEVEFRDYLANHSIGEAASYYGVSTGLICKWSRNFDIPRRHFKYKEVGENLTAHQQEIINGSLLGDGCLEKITTDKENSRFVEKHGIQQLEYLEWKQTELITFSTKISTGQETRRGKINKFCRFKTIKHPLFTRLERKWYNPNRIKIIPDDLVITPLTLTVWFLDDGYNAFHEKWPSAWLFTNAFSEDSIRKLQTKLVDTYGLFTQIIRSAPSRGQRPQIYFSKKQYPLLMDIITPYVPVNCMKYKIRRK